MLATGVLATTIRNSCGRRRPRTTPRCSTTPPASTAGDDVRIAGVKVGTVTGRGRSPTTGWPRSPSRSARACGRPGSVIQIKFRNRRPALPGRPQPGRPALHQRHRAGQRHTAASRAVKPGHTFGVDETRPALDLTVLFNGFRPLLQLLNPEDVNNLSDQIIAVFQGEGATVDGLLQSTASLTSTLAEKDQVIGELITSLSVGADDGQRPVRPARHHAGHDAAAGLRAGRGPHRRSATRIEGLGDLTTSVVGPARGRPRAAARSRSPTLGDLSANLANAQRRRSTASSHEAARSSSTGSAGSAATARGSTSTSARWTDGSRCPRATWATSACSPSQEGAADGSLPTRVRRAQQGRARRGRPARRWGWCSTAR